MSQQQPAEEATAWSVVADRDDEGEGGLPGFLRGTVLSGSSTTGWLLRNDGPHPARRVELLPEDPEQLVEGPLRWDEIPAGGTVAFRAGRRLLTDNGFRLRWFQQRDDSRYWRIVNLPGS
jgi:hypothetical protein